MVLLIAGLVLFLGAHSVRIFADEWRTRQLATKGEGTWKGMYSVISIAGIVLIAYGYGAAHTAPIDLWFPPAWTRHPAALLTLVSFILIVATYVPGTHIKAKLKHPMVLGVKVWAFAHLLANGRLADVILFGAFLLWAILNFRAARKRDRAADITYQARGAVRDVIAIIVGVAAWLAFALYLHAALMGVRPFA